jgi:hypothetical protein
MRFRFLSHAPKIQPLPIMALPMIPILICALTMYMMSDSLSQYWTLEVPQEAFSRDSGLPQIANDTLRFRMNASGIRAVEPRRIVDGVFLTDGTLPDPQSAAIWDESDGSLELMLFENAELESITLQVDGDDIYIIETMDGGSGWVTLAVIPAALRGEQRGLETYSSDPDSHYFVRSLRIPPGRYHSLRIRAVAGPKPYVLSELALSGHRRN